MARREKTTVRLDRVVREMVDTILDARLTKLAGGGDLGRKLRDIERALGRIERRLDRLSARGTTGGRRAGAGRPGRPPLHETCLVEGCGAEHYALGLCSRHYQQYRRGRTDLREIVERAKAMAAQKQGKKQKKTASKGKVRTGRSSRNASRSRKKKSR